VATAGKISEFAAIVTAAMPTRLLRLFVLVRALRLYFKLAEVRHAVLFTAVCACEFLHDAAHRALPMQRDDAPAVSSVCGSVFSSI
jgi:transcriptional regulator of met regulon